MLESSLGLYFKTCLPAVFFSNIYIKTNNVWLKAGKYADCFFAGRGDCYTKSFYHEP